MRKPNVFQSLYNCEVNCEISSFFDAGFEVRFGDRLNGFGEAIPAYTWAEVTEIIELKLEALRNKRKKRKEVENE